MWRRLFTKNDPSHVFARYLGPVIIYRLGRAEDFGGYHLNFGRTKGGFSRNWEPKRGDHWKLWKDSEGGSLKFA